MKHARLQLDYVAPPRRWRAPGIALLAAALAVAAALGWRYREVRIELDRVHAAQSLIGGERRAPAKTRDDEIRGAEAVVRQLALPWASMVHAVEVAASVDVALLQMQPDARERQLRLVAEAAGEREMLAFLRRLAASGTLAEVHLASHQTMLDEPRRPLQFTVLARLKEGALSRLRALLERLGVAGVVGLGVLAACLPLYFSALAPAERELSAQRAAAAVRARGPVRPVAYDARAEELARFYQLFPPIERVGEQLERLYALARKAGLELQQGEYRVERPSHGLISYRVVLPVRGSYAQVRAFAGSVLGAMPVASIDTLRFERRKSAEAQLDAQLRLTLYLRPPQETP